ncbi:uncharacterized protein [Periplaneta americana]|uniref:uncharacterized protein n=1 Tax=Periplaneta americana TaxID=6978 RepID=UPI0037E95C18
MASLKLSSVFCSIFVLIQLWIVIAQPKKVCKIPPSIVTPDSPKILMNENESVASSTRNYKTGDYVTFICTDSIKNVMVITNRNPRVEHQILAHCVQDTSFRIDRTIYNFSQIICQKPPPITHRNVGHCSNQTEEKVQIGFRVGRGFISLIEACYDVVRDIPVTTRHILRKYVKRVETEDDRRNFHKRRIADHRENVFRCENQFANLETLIRSSTEARRYINCKEGGDMYFVRGFLAPISDFLPGYQFEEKSYVYNTAPQWLTANVGNWLHLENKIRSYVNKKNTDLAIMTGTLQVTTLPDYVGVERHLYLDAQARKTPVPALFWKLLHDQSRNAGIVFIGVNNPYHSSPRAHGYIICTCMCSKAKGWFNDRNRFDTQKGYIYCCTVEEFVHKTNIFSVSFNVRKILDYS